MLAHLARYRVSIGFVCAAVAFGLATPSWGSWRIGAVIALSGELLRIWAAGHLEKSREITRSGPYRFVRHPLYLGSILLGVGFAAAARNIPVAVMVALYLSITLLAAVRTEEAALDAKFSGGYSEYRAGRAEPVRRRFSWTRARSNREYRAVIGVAAAFLILAFRVGA